MKTYALKMLTMTSMVALTLTACQERVTPPAKIEVSDPVIEVLDGTEYHIVTTDSVLSFTGTKETGTHSGGWSDFTGLITVPDGDFAKASFVIDIDVESMTSDDTDLTDTMKSEKMFDSANFPDAKFEATSITAVEGKTNIYAVVGNLTLHGVTSGVKFDAIVKLTEKKLTAEAEFNMNRKDFDINYDGLIGDLIHENVEMSFYVEAEVKP